jgi:hypothetical protein
MHHDIKTLCSGPNTQLHAPPPHTTPPPPQALRQVLAQQQLPCGCQVYSHTLLANQPAVLLSSAGRSLLRDACSLLQLPLAPQKHLPGEGLVLCRHVGYGELKGGGGRRGGVHATCCCSCWHHSSTSQVRLGGAERVDTCCLHGVEQSSNTGPGNGQNICHLRACVC